MLKIFRSTGDFETDMKTTINQKLSPIFHRWRRRREKLVEQSKPKSKKQHATIYSLGPKLRVAPIAGQ